MERAKPGRRNCRIHRRRRRDCPLCCSSGVNHTTGNTNRQRFWLWGLSQMCCVGARGTTMRTTRAARTATGTRPPIRTTTTGFGVGFLLRQYSPGGMPTSSARVGRNTGSPGSVPGRRQRRSKSSGAPFQMERLRTALPLVVGSVVLSKLGAGALLRHCGGGWRRSRIIYETGDRFCRQLWSRSRGPVTLPAERLDGGSGTKQQWLAVPGANLEPDRLSKAKALPGLKRCENDGGG